MTLNDKTRCAYPWQQIVIDLNGDVVPCCFYSAYGGDAQKVFGNTNAQTLAEIWNGPGYQELRQRHVEGNLDNHPCNQCVAYYWNNEDYPQFQWPSGIVPEKGKAYITKISEKFQAQCNQRPEDVKLLEDGKEIGLGNSLHDDIRNLGGGRYSVWYGVLYFSTPDDSDPVTNGRTYELRWDEHCWQLARLERPSASGKNLLRAYQEYKDGVQKMHANPTMLTWSSSADCNIDCGYCSQNMYRVVKLQHRPQTEVDVLKLVPDLIYFSWAGGEPYFLKNFRDFIDNFEPSTNPNLTFGFTSNGTTLSAKDLEKLEKFPRISATFSIDSFIKESYEKLRYGAHFDRVMGNVLRAVATNDVPDRNFICGQLVLKSNFLELPFNVQFAIDHGLGVNFSPVTTYPVNERIDLFWNFVEQTAGWQEALDEAVAIATRAHAQKSLAIQRVDMRASLSAVQAILHAAVARYRETTPIRFRVEDPSQSLAKMTMPGIIVSYHGQEERLLTYVPLNRGAGEYACHAPKAEVRQGGRLLWEFCADLQEPWIRHGRAFLKTKAGVYWHKASPQGLTGEALATTPLVIPEFTPPVRQRNATIANFGLPVQGGLETRSKADIWAAVRELELLEKQQTTRASNGGDWTQGRLWRLRRLYRSLRKAVNFGT